MATYRPVTLITDPGYLEHDTGDPGEHPECPERLRAVLERLERNAMGLNLVRRPPRRARREDLRAVHTEAYLLGFEEACLSGQEAFGHSDNRIVYASYDIALLAAGAGCEAVDLIEAGEAELAFCAVRPPGHHAEAALALGFCFLNNIAVAVRYWQRVHGVRRIFILDWDAHHGNGIQEIFAADPEVFYASIHEHPTFSFPGTGYAYERGEGPGEGTTLNFPLPPGSGDDAVMRLIEDELDRAVDDFQPEAFVVAAGFDGHSQDDMSGLAYSTELYVRLGPWRPSGGRGIVMARCSPSLRAVIIWRPWRAGWRPTSPVFLC